MTCMYYAPSSSRESALASVQSIKEQTHQLVYAWIHSFNDLLRQFFKLLLHVWAASFISIHFFWHPILSSIEVSRGFFTDRRQFISGHLCVLNGFAFGSCILTLEDVIQTLISYWHSIQMRLGIIEWISFRVVPIVNFNCWVRFDIFLKFLD